MRKPGPSQRVPLLVLLPPGAWPFSLPRVTNRKARTGPHSCPETKAANYKSQKAEQDLCCLNRAWRSQTNTHAHTHAHEPATTPPTTNPSRQRDAGWGLEAYVFHRKWSHTGVVTTLSGREAGTVGDGERPQWAQCASLTRIPLPGLTPCTGGRISPDPEAGLSWLAPLNGPGMGPPCPLDVGPRDLRS